jgi:Transcriptional regulator
MVTTRRESNKIKCRQRILKASRRLFNSKGYEGTMIEDIAEKADISKATFYNYFPNKESLLLGTAEDELSIIQDLLENELKDEPDSDKKLRAVIEFLVLDGLPFINLSRRLTYLNSCKDSPLYKVRLGIISIFKQLISEAMSQGKYKENFTVDEIEDVYMSIYLVTQFEWTHISSYSEEFCKEKLNRLMNTVLAGVYAE